MVPSGVHCCTGGELADAAPELSSDLVPSSTEHITPFQLAIKLCLKYELNNKRLIIKDNIE